jgi:chemotaxis protein CheD
MMLKEGARSSSIIAKIAGGAAMFAVSSDAGDLMKVGERNIFATKEKLKTMGIFHFSRRYRSELWSNDYF